MRVFYEIRLPFLIGISLKILLQHSEVSESVTGVDSCV